MSDSPVDRDRGRNERDAGGTPSIKSEPHDGNPVDTFHSVSEVLQSVSCIHKRFDLHFYPLKIISSTFSSAFNLRLYFAN